MTQQLWAKSIDTDDGMHSCSAIMAGSGPKGGEKVEALSKLNLSAEMRSLCSDAGVFDDLKELASFMQGKMAATTEEAVPVDDTTPTNTCVLGQRHAVSTGLLDLLEGDSVIGQRRRASDPPPAPAPKRPAVVAAARPAAPAPPRSACGSPPAGGPPPAGDEHGSAEATDGDASIRTDFCQELTEAIESLPKRPKDIIEKLIGATLTPIGSDDLAKVKTTTVDTHTKKCTELKTKLKTTHAHIAEMLGTTGTILDQLTVVAENQSLQVAEKKQRTGAKGATVTTTKKSCDSVALFGALLIFEHHHLSIGFYLYRVTWEARVDTFFHDFDLELLSQCMSTCIKGARNQKILSIMDLSARGFPSHELESLQSTAVTEKIGHALAKNYATPTLQQLTTAFKGVRAILSEATRTQLDVLDTLLFPADKPREKLNAALAACKNSTEGLFHHLRYQRKSSEIKSTAAKYCGAIIGAHLAVSKIERLTTLLDSCQAIFEDPNESFTNCRSLYDEVCAQTAGNDAFATQHADILSRYRDMVKDLRADYRSKVASALEAYVAKLSEDIPAEKVVASRETALALGSACKKDATAHHTAFKKMAGHDATDDDLSYAIAYSAYIETHAHVSQLAGAQGCDAAAPVPLATVITRAIGCFNKTSGMAWRTSEMHGCYDKFSTEFQLRVYRHAFPSCLVSNADKVFGLLTSTFGNPDKCMTLLNAILATPPSDQTGFFASLPDAYGDGASFVQQFDPPCCEITALSELPGHPLSDIADMWHACFINHSLAGALALWKPVCTGTIYMRCYFVLRDVAFEDSSLTMQTSTAKSLDEFLGSIIAKVELLRSVRETTTTALRDVRCGNKFIDFTNAGLNRAACNQDLDGKWKQWSDFSFTDLKDWPAASDRWYNDRLTELRGVYCSLVQSLLGFLQPVVDHITAFKDAHKSFESVDVQLFRDMLACNGNNHVMHISQLVFAVNRLIAFAKEKCADMSLVQESCTGIRHPHHPSCASIEACEFLSARTASVSSTLSRASSYQHPKSARPNHLSETVGRGVPTFG